MARNVADTAAATLNTMTTCPACGQRVRRHPEGGPVAHKITSESQAGRFTYDCSGGRPDPTIWETP